MNENILRTVTLAVNGKEAKDELQRIDKELEKTRDLLSKAWQEADTKGISKYKKAISKLEREQAKIVGRTKTVEETMRNLDKATPSKLNAAIRELRRQLDSGAVERNSEEWKHLQAAIAEAKAELREIKKEEKLIGTSESISKWGIKWVGLTTILSQAVSAFQNLMGRMEGFVRDFAQMEEAEADVMKYTGMTKQQVESLNASLQRIDTRTSRERLNALAGDAGRLGLQSKQDILDFVDAADKINVALGEDLGEDAVKNIGKLAMLYGEDKDKGLRGAMLATGSAINELAQNSAASEPYLLDFTARLAGVGKQAGISQTDIMGFAAVLDESMLRDETAATALQQLITKVFQEPAKFAKIAGLEMTKFSNLLKTDANAALLQFFETMKSKGGFDSLAPMFSAMHINGQRAVGVLSAVADKLDNVRARQQLASQAYQQATSITNEFNVKNQTVQAQLEKTEKRLRDLRVELGQRLYPLMNSGLVVVQTILAVLSTLLTFTTRNISLIASLAVAYGTLVAAQKLSVAWKQTEISMSKLQLLWNEKVQVSFKKLWAAMLANPLGVVAAAMAVVVGLLNNMKNHMQRVVFEQSKLNDVQREAQERLSEQKVKMEALLRVARDENASLKDRKRAIDELNRVIPNYNGQLDATTGKYRENKRALDAYLSSLLRQYEIEGAKDIIKDTAREIASLQAQMSQLEEKYPVLKGVRGRKLAIQMGHNYTEASAATQWLSDVTHAVVAGEEGNAMYEYGKLADQLRLANKSVASINKTFGNEIFNSILKEDTSGGGSGGSGGSSGGSTDDKKDKHDTKTDQQHRDRLQQLAAQAKDLDRELREKEAQITARFVGGETDIDQWREQTLRAQVDTATAQRDLYQKDLDWQVEKWKEQDDKLQTLQAQQRERRKAWSLEDSKQQEKDELAALEDQYASGLLSLETYELRKNELTLRYLRQRAEMHRQWGDAENFVKAQRAVEEESLRQRREFQKKLSEATRKFQQEQSKLSPLRQVEEEIRLLEARRDEALRAAEGDVQKMMQLSALFSQMLQSLQQKRAGLLQTSGSEILKAAGYQAPSAGSMGEGVGGVVSIASQAKNFSDTQQTLRDQLAADLISQTEYNNALAELEAQKYERIAGYATAAYQTIGSAMQSVSQLMQANYELEAAKVEERYDREIAAAGEGTAKAKQLEAQKQKELAALKNKYNKKAMTMEIAQAVASTATAAINAYASASKISWVLGPIAAAMATAAGAIQIATIKKQHEAQAKGYYEGGFTGGTRYRREAGVVHEGEFVANHRAVQNPALLPVLSLIDQAQRQNRVASLTARDIARVTGPGQAAAQAQPVIIDSSSQRTAESLEKLGALLERPIQTYVVIDGPDGLDRKLKEYQRLTNGS